MGINRYKERHATSGRIKNRDIVEEQMEEVERVEGEQVESEDVVEKGKKQHPSISVKSALNILLFSIVG